MPIPPSPSPGGWAGCACATCPQAKERVKRMLKATGTLSQQVLRLREGCGVWDGGPLRRPLCRDGGGAGKGVGGVWGRTNEHPRG